MKVYIVTSGDIEYPDEDYYLYDIEAVFTTLSQAAMYIISHKEENENLRIEEYEADETVYLGSKIPKKIVMGKYYPESDLWAEEKIAYDYYCCEEIIEKENCVLLSTTVPVETSNSQAFDILKDNYTHWKNANHRKKEV